MSRQPSANSAWIQSSFGDFDSSSSSNSKSKLIKKSSSSGFTANGSSSSSSSSSTAIKRKAFSRGSANNEIAKLSTRVVSTQAILDEPSFKRPKKLVPRRPSKPGQQPDERSLLDVYSPFSVADLAIHSRKLKELRDCFERSSSTAGNRGVSFLLATGPSGCGKLSAVRAVGKECGYDITEWTEPLHWREWRNYKSEDSTSQLEIIRAPQLDEFSSFLLRASRVTALELTGLVVGDQGKDRKASNQLTTTGESRMKVIVVKDLPNEFCDKATEFSTILKSYARKASKVARVLVVFIMSTNGGNGFQWQRLFSKELLEQLRFDVVEFNAIANTLMNKALRRIIEGERMDISKPHLDQLVETANGDIRFAVNELQFLHSGHGLQRVASKASGRDNTLLLFRALGRCIYSKRNEDLVDLCDDDGSLPAHLQQFSRPHPLDFDPDMIVEQSGFQPSTFSLFLEENVWNVFTESSRTEVDEAGSLESLTSMLETFSAADVLTKTSDYESREKLSAYEKSLPPRAVAFYGYENSVKRKGTYSYKSMRRPIWLDTARKIRNLEGKPKRPAIHAKNGSVSISEYVPFARKSDQVPYRSVAKLQLSSGSTTMDDISASMMEEDDNDSQAPGASDQGETKMGSCSYTIRDDEIANISIEEFDD